MFIQIWVILTEKAECVLPQHGIFISV